MRERETILKRSSQFFFVQIKTSVRVQKSHKKCKMISLRSGEKWIEKNNRKTFVCSERESERLDEESCTSLRSLNFLAKHQIFKDRNREQKNNANLFIKIHADHLREIEFIKITLHTRIFCVCISMHL